MYWTSIPANNPSEEEDLRQKVAVVEIPDSVVQLASATHILSKVMGFSASAEQQTGVTGDGAPMPMMSYSVVEYLSGLDLSNFDLLELGGGGSTAYWASRVKSMVTLETNSLWAVKLRSIPNTDVRTCPVEKVPETMLGLGRTFDAVIVDAAANRYQCAKAAVSILRPGGFILLDNSDWYPNTAAMLRDADLIEVDFHDFRPGRHYRCTTSLFLHREFRPSARSNRLPRVPLGGKDMATGNRWDEPR